jgi:hypothetical protein
MRHKPGRFREDAGVRDAEMAAIRIALKLV